MSRRGQIVAATGLGIAVGFLGAVVVGTVSAQNFDGFRTFFDRGQFIIEPDPTERTFGLFLDPLDARNPSLGFLPPGRPVAGSPKPFEKVIVYELVPRARFDGTNWIGCLPAASCSAPPRTLSSALFRIYEGCTPGNNRPGENGTNPDGSLKCCDGVDNDNDCSTDVLDGECAQTTCPSPQP